MEQQFVLLLFMLLLLLMVVCITVAIKFNKGKVSEKRVRKQLKRLPEDYYSIHDCLLLNNGYTTQIDHIIVSPYGIFVIETKGYQGWIFGGEDSEYWTQSIYGHKTMFYNPIRQNSGHVRFLTHLLKEFGSIPFIPIVVFNNEASLKLSLSDNIVVNRCYLYKAIEQYKQPVLPKELLPQIIETITNHTTTEKGYARQHINQVKTKELESHNRIRSGICPRCGGQLVIRSGKYGSFYGCSNYPKCKFTFKDSD